MWRKPGACSARTSGPMGSSQTGRRSRRSAATSTSRASPRGWCARTNSSCPVWNEAARHLRSRGPSRFGRLAEEARAFEAVAPRLFHRLGEPDARADGDVDVLRARAYLEWRRIERKGVLRAGDAERLAQASRPRAQQALVRDAAAAAHRGEALRGRERADEHRAGTALRLAYEVEAPVHAVGAVDIGVARRTEHHAVALGAAAERMRGRIGVMVGLDLDDDAADALEQQRRADEIGSDRVHAAGKETSAEQLGHRGVSTGGGVAA